MARSPEIDRLIRFAEAVRDSSLKRFRAVTAGRENWRPSEGAMSFADLAQHLVDCDDWLLRKLADPTLAAMVGQARSVTIDSRDQYAALLARLEDSGRRRLRGIERLTEAELEDTVPDERFEGRVSVWWLIVRGNLDHEIHHRGQVSAYLRALGIQVPSE